MKNVYWLLRHGRSLANEAGVIISKKENGIKEQWRLVEEGRNQAQKAGELLGKELGEEGASSLYVYASPFSRTVETAKLAAGKAGLVDFDNNFQTSDLLVERDFGHVLEGKPYEGAYEAVWATDAVGLESRSGEDGESLSDVSQRIRTLFEELELKHSGASILLVSHGDTLSILQATMEGSDVRQHRIYSFGTGELRKLESGPTTSH